MSMYRQLWLALILSTLLSLIGGLLASTLSARAYLQEQLRMKNNDNATALALSLSQRNVDLVEVEVTVAALFDSGHYESIRVIDPFGKMLIERVAQIGLAEAPEWFIKRLPIGAPAGQAQISNGWKQVGTVLLVSNSQFAYKALWKSTMEMIFALCGAGLIGAYLGTLILRRLKRPLDAVIDQARAITERRFVTTPEPKVPELRQLAGAMNSAVTRLKSMFDEEASRLESVRQEANCDALTGLANRAYFMARLRAAIDSEETSTGSLMLIRVANLSEVNKRLGRQATDELIKTIARVMDTYAHAFPDGLAARLNGADFGLMLLQGEPGPIAEELLGTLIRETSALFENEPVAFIGFGQFRFGVDAGLLLTQVDASLAGAETEGVSSVREAVTIADDEAPRSAAQWSQMILQALQEHWVRLVSFPVADFSGHLIHRECPLRLMFSAEGEWLPAGRFLPIAERLGMTAALDLAAVKLGLEKLTQYRDLPGLAVNLSARSVQDAAFRQQLRAAIIEQPNASHRLWLEVAENGALAHLDAFRHFCNDLEGTGCKLGIEHFGRQFSKIGLLHNLGLDYLKVDASFIRSVESNPGNQAFLKGLTAIAHNIGLQVFAEGVVSSFELQTLSTLGFDGATGPAVQDTAENQSPD